MGGRGWPLEPQRCEGARKSTEPRFRSCGVHWGAERSTEDLGASSGTRAKTRRPDGGSEPCPSPQRRPLTGQSRQPGGPAWGRLGFPTPFAQGPQQSQVPLGAQGGLR